MLKQTSLLQYQHSSPYLWNSSASTEQKTNYLTYWSIVLLPINQLACLFSWAFILSYYTNDILLCYRHMVGFSGHILDVTSCTSKLLNLCSQHANQIVVISQHKGNTSLADEWVSCSGMNSWNKRMNCCLDIFKGVSLVLNCCLELLKGVGLVFKQCTSIKFVLEGRFKETELFSE